MEWPKKIDSSIWRLIPPAVALDLHVVPIAREGDRITFVIGDRGTSESHRNQIASALALTIGLTEDRIKVLDLSEFSDSAESEFKDFLNKRYDVEQEVVICDSVAGDAMTVLLVSNRKQVAKFVEKSLFGSRTDRLHGTRIVAVGNLSEAHEIATSKAGIGKVIIDFQSVNDEIESVIQKFQNSCGARIIILLDECHRDKEEWFALPKDEIEIVYFGDGSERLVNAIAS